MPAAAMGIDVSRLLDATLLMVRSCAANVRRPTTQVWCLGPSWVCWAGRAATKSPLLPLRALSISGQGSNNSSRNQPASTAGASSPSTPNRLAHGCLRTGSPVRLYAAVKRGPTRSKMTRSRRWNAAVIQWCESPSPTATSSARNFSAGDRHRRCRLRPGHRSFRPAGCRGEQG